MPRKRKQDQDGLYRRPDSLNWWATYSDASGKRVRCSTGTTDRKEADRLLAKWKADTHRERHWDIKAETTFEELMVAYLSYSENKRSAKTDRYRAVNLRAYFAGQIMNRLEPSRIRGFMVVRRQAGVSDSTINRDLALLSSAINFGNRELELNLPNPIRGRMLDEPESRTRWITREEAERLIDAATHARKVPFLADFITLALYTGCRKEELMGLEWARVDLSSSLIHLDAMHTKSKKRRSIPLCDSARSVLIRRAAFRASHCPASPWVFALETGGRMHDFRHAFHAACDKAGIENFRIHDLRHTCAAWLVTAGVPLAEIRDILGHSTILMTEKYAHLAPDNLRSAIARLDTPRHVCVTSPSDGIQKNR